MDNLTDQQNDKEISPIQRAAEIAETLTGATLDDMVTPGHGRRISDARAIFIEAATRLGVKPTLIALAIKRTHSTVLSYLAHYPSRYRYYNGFRLLADALDLAIPPKKPTPCFFEPHLLRTCEPPAPPHDTRLGFRFTSEEETRYRDVIAQARVEAAERYEKILPRRYCL